VLCAKFKASVNMSPAAIRRWAKDPRAKEASFPATRRRLPALATLRAKPCSQWTRKDEAFARRVVSFNSRMEGVVRVHGCSRKAVVALKNWGRSLPRCRL